MGIGRYHNSELRGKHSKCADTRVHAFKSTFNVLSDFIPSCFVSDFKKDLPTERKFQEFSELGKEAIVLNSTKDPNEMCDSHLALVLEDGACAGREKQESRRREFGRSCCFRYFFSICKLDVAGDFNGKAVKQVGDNL